MTGEDWTLELPEGGALAGTWHAGEPGRTPLVLLHGFGGSRGDWDLVAPRLEAADPGRPHLAYDLRGCGGSRPLGTESYAHVADLAAVVASLGSGPVDLVGLSLGGATALAFALDHPRAVRRLVLISPLVNGWRFSDDWIARWKEVGRAARGGDLAAARALWWCHPLFAGVRHGPEAARQHAAIEAYAGEAWVADPHRAVPADAGRLGALAVPTLLLTGERDLADFRTIAQLLAHGAPGLEWRDLAGHGHMLNLEAPAEVADAVLGFLRPCGDAPAR